MSGAIAEHEDRAFEDCFLRRFASGLGPDLLRLGSALSALSPNPNEERRLLEATLLAVPR